MIEQEFSVGRNAEIDIHIRTGRVKVKTGNDGIIRVDVDTNDQGFMVEQRGNLIYVSSDKNTRWSARGSAYVVLEVPDGTDVTVGTASARIECNGPLGRVEVKTASGRDSAGRECHNQDGQRRCELRNGHKWPQDQQRIRRHHYW